MATRRFPPPRFKVALMCSRLALSMLAQLAAFATQALAADMITGIPHVVDGDTLTIGAIKIRLQGIDAPETEQVCLDQQAEKWTCGIAARDHLAQHIGGQSINCTPSGTDKFGRTLALCRLVGDDLNAWMVGEGWALAFIRYSRDYVTQEEQAREAHRGMWSGALIAPWDWRHHCDKTTEVLGTTMVPLTARSKFCGPIDAPPGCPIKSNLRSKDGCIYFTPGQLDYSRLDMDKPGRRWFCSEEDAQAAGCRSALR
jgi:endonuclease YncB( thermonuclease family)